MSEVKPIIWIDRDYLKCSGCRMCEVVCSLRHENRIWPEASMIRIFMFVPGVEIPHLCTQCYDYPCVNSCPCEALAVDGKTGAVKVDKEKCSACGVCVNTCPGKIPHLHPNRKHIVICDLCGGDPECAKICQKAGFDALKVIILGQRSDIEKLVARTPREMTNDLAINLYGEKSEEFI
ncbi:MAG: 4Fe-4S dicluster domain-containing protein [Candidatus Bathyarchaeota archaeon]|nr:4Fe-4S dicluster domain-containing protein [Candidatus Bathyarchaeota archaeon]